MIVLTDAQADKARGLSPTNRYAALDPVPLKDGTWMLPEEVLADPAHKDVTAFLTSLPTQDIAKLPLYPQDENGDLSVPDLAEVRARMVGKDATKPRVAQIVSEALK